MIEIVELLTGIFMGIMFQLVILAVLAVIYTAVIAVIVYQYRREQRRKKETIKMLKAAIPPSMTVSS